MTGWGGILRWTEVRENVDPSRTWAPFNSNEHASAATFSPHFLEIVKKLNVWSMRQLIWWSALKCSSPAKVDVRRSSYGERTLRTLSKVTTHCQCEVEFIPHDKCQYVRRETSTFTENWRNWEPIFSAAGVNAIIRCLYLRVADRYHIGFKIVRESSLGAQFLTRCDKHASHLITQCCLLLLKILNVSLCTFRITLHFDIRL